MTVKFFLYLSLLVLGWNLAHYFVRVSKRTHFEGQGLVLETLAGTLLLGGYLLGVGMTTTATPLTSRTEIFALFAVAILAVYLVTVLIDELRSMGGLVVPVAITFIVLAGLQPLPGSGTAAGGTNGGIGISWPHIFFIVTAYGAFSVSFLMAVGYLRAEHQLKKKSVGGFFFMLPSLEALDEGLHRTIWIGILLLVAGMTTAVFGGLYRGSITVSWIRDPNVLGAIITGLIYGTILYIRKRSLFTNRRIAFLAIFGFLLIGVLFFSMNFFPRMHRFL